MSAEPGGGTRVRLIPAPEFLLATGRWLDRTGQCTNALATAGIGHANGCHQEKYGQRQRPQYLFPVHGSIIQRNLNLVLAVQQRNLRDDA